MPVIQVENLAKVFRISFRFWLFGLRHYASTGS
jgi:ABC-type uncharacterized transport system permease subunit